MTKPRRFILSSNNTIHAFAPPVTGQDHRKIEPTTMHHSLLRTTHLSWPETTNRLKSIYSYLIMQEINFKRFNIIQ